MTTYRADRGLVELGDAIQSGGEGTVYRIKGYPSSVAKIYKQYYPDYAQKLIWMRSNPPHDPTLASGHASIAWPIDLLYDNNGLVGGFIMAFIKNAVPLFSVYNPRARSRSLPDFNWKYLHSTALNLAVVLNTIHTHGYVVGDVNESNIMVTPSANVTIIDTDSFQVYEKSANVSRLYPCPVGKLEYTPPELQGVSYKNVIRLPQHDCFGLGVLIFQLLMNGNHPFKSQWLGAGEAPKLEEKIRMGCFPYATPSICSVAPPSNAQSLEVLHPRLADLFQLCFVNGHRDPNLRPTPGMWELALREAVQLLVKCPSNHYYSSHLSACPFCMANAQRATVTSPIISVPPPIPAPPPNFSRSPQVAASAPKDARVVRRMASIGFVSLLLFLILRQPLRMGSLCSTTQVTIEGNSIVINDTARWTGVGQWLSVWLSINGKQYFEEAVFDKDVIQVNDPIKEVTLLAVRVVNSPLTGPPDQTCYLSIALTNPIRSDNVASSNEELAYAAAPTQSEPASSSVVMGRVVSTNGNANVRPGPSKNSTAFTSIPSGSNLIVLGKKSDNMWLLVQLQDGRQGWMSADLLDLKGQEVPVVTASSAPAQVVWVQRS